MQKTQNDVSIDAIASGFRSGFAEMGSIWTCWENAAACGFRVGFAEMASISSRGGHVHAFTYDYVKTRTEHPAPHDLSASQSEAPLSECVVLESTKCGFQSGFGEMAGISTRGGHVRAFTYDYVKTHLEHPAPHDLLSSGGNKVCFATTPPDMEASCKTKQQSGYATRYTFSAKEKDDETQYSYFGARYYDSDLSVWLSVDPMSDKHANYTPYSYVYNNPVVNIDPYGLDTILVNRKSGEVLGRRAGGEDYVFQTNKRKESDRAWRKSEQLFYTLNISGESGGTHSEKGDPVIWSDLQNKTSEFDAILKNSMFHFSMMNEKFDEEGFSVPGNKNVSKLAYFAAMVDDNAPFDIKNSSYHPRRIGEWSWYHGRLTRYDDYGNILFGAIGAAFGIRYGLLSTGATINQLGKGSFDDSRDQTMILKGIFAFSYYLDHIPTIK